MFVLIDSYAWVEYFIGSKKGTVLNELFKDGSYSFFTVECCLAEIKGWSIKNNKKFAKLYDVIRANSELIKINEQDWIDAATEKANQRKIQRDFGLIDAMIMTKQKQLNAYVISGDKHFKCLKDTIFMN